MSPRELLIRLRDPDCNACPIYEECQEEENCMLLKEAADCIEHLIKETNHVY